LIYKTSAFCFWQEKKDKNKPGNKSAFFKEKCFFPAGKAPQKRCFYRQKSGAKKRGKIGGLKLNFQKTKERTPVIVQSGKQKSRLDIFKNTVSDWTFKIGH
jgi:hypothetical protein